MSDAPLPGLLPSSLVPPPNLTSTSSSGSTTVEVNRHQISRGYGSSGNANYRVGSNEWRDFHPDPSVGFSHEKLRASERAWLVEEYGGDVEGKQKRKKEAKEAIEAQKIKARAKLPNWDKAGTVTVKLVVGRELKEFIIHKDFICLASDAMKAAFCGEFKEGKTGIMTLAEDDALVFQGFASFCYPDFRVQSLESLTAHQLVELYIFADKYRCQNRLKNTVMNSLQDKMVQDDTMILDDSTMMRIFENTTSAAESPIRTYCAALVSFALFNLKHYATDELHQTLHQTLLNLPNLQLATLEYQIYTRMCNCPSAPESVLSDPRYHSKNEKSNCWNHSVAVVQ